MCGQSPNSTHPLTHPAMPLDHVAALSHQAYPEQHDLHAGERFVALNEVASDRARKGMTIGSLDCCQPLEQYPLLACPGRHLYFCGQDFCGQDFAPAAIRAPTRGDWCGCVLGGLSLNCLTSSWIRERRHSLYMPGNRSYCLKESRRMNSLGNCQVLHRRCHGQRHADLAKAGISLN